MFKTRRTLSLLLAASMAFTAISCKSARNVEALQEGLTTKGLQTFAPANQRLMSVQFFLWDDDVQTQNTTEAGKKVAELKAIGDRVFELDAASAKLRLNAEPIEAEIARIKVEHDYDSLIGLKTLYKDKIKKANAAIEKLTGELATIESGLTENKRLLDEEKAKEQPDQQKIGELEAAIQKLEKDKAKKEKDKAKKETELADLRKKDEDNEGKLEVAESAIDPHQEKLLPIKFKMDESQEEYRALVGEATKKVHWYQDMPSSVAFQFKDDGGIYVSISEWNFERHHPTEPKGAKLNFSTEAEEGKKPTIRDVSYTRLGGVMKFYVDVYEPANKDEAASMRAELGEIAALLEELKSSADADPAEVAKREARLKEARIKLAQVEQARLKESFFFNIARTKYEKKNFVYYYGDITKTEYLEDGKTVVRKGVAKLNDNKLGE